MEGFILFILCATVSGIIAITKQLDEANTALKALQKDNEVLHTSRHNQASKFANEKATTEDVRTINNVIRDVSHRVLAPTTPYAQPPHVPPPTG